MNQTAEILIGVNDGLRNVGIIGFGVGAVAFGALLVFQIALDYLSYRTNK